MYLHSHVNGDMDLSKAADGGILHHAFEPAMFYVCSCACCSSCVASAFSGPLSGDCADETFQIVQHREQNALSWHENRTCHGIGSKARCSGGKKCRPSAMQTPNPLLGKPWSECPDSKPAMAMLQVRKSKSNEAMTYKEKRYKCACHSQEKICSMLAAAGSFQHHGQYATRQMCINLQLLWSAFEGEDRICINLRILR